MALALPALQIRQDDLTDPRIEAFMQEHLQDMYAASPPESVHALDMDQLRQPDITFWSAWLCASDGNTTLVSTGALKQLDATHGELKSTRTSARHRGQGIAHQVLDHLLQEARARRFARVSLETGPQPFFEPARQLYFRHGFIECGPFADYGPDPYSFFMTRTL